MSELSSEDLSRRLSQLDGWTVRDGALERSFDRGDFAGSMAFLGRIAEAAEEADHHPDVTISWGTVTLRWVTHSADGITAADMRMAVRSNEIAAA
jgi:4a-hydroxytetrahydrobiopterin dehydratase